MTFSAYPKVVQTMEKYQYWLLTQPISQNTWRTYTTRVQQFCSFLYEGTTIRYGDPFREENARDFAVRDFRVRAFFGQFQGLTKFLWHARKRALVTGGNQITSSL